MKILWFTWKDKKNPYAGGAEIVNEEIAKRLVRDGHEVTFLVSWFGGAPCEEAVDGYKIIRVGNYRSVYWKAYKYYKKNLQGWADLTIDEVNTIPFFAKFYVKEKNILFFHQLCRQIWFYQIGFPANVIGYLLEPVYLWMLRNKKVITVSESTRNDLEKYGFKKENVHIVSEGIEINPVEKLEPIEKYPEITMLSLGAIRPMKRADHILKAFELAKKRVPGLRLIIAGNAPGKHGHRILDMIRKSKYKNSIEYSGPVSIEKKIELMQKSHFIAVASVKEGWGLTVTEANSQGIPAVVYDVDGLRDSTRNRETGLICEENTPECLARKIVEMAGICQNKENYDNMRQRAWQWSKEINFDKCYQDFLLATNIK